jgi:hypothetical protein
MKVLCVIFILYEEIVMKVMTMEQAKQVHGGGPISSLGSLAVAAAPVVTALGQFLPTLGGYLQNPKSFNSNGK